MPYIVTTRRTETAEDGIATQVDSSRRAVATLKEARRAALGALDGLHANEIGSAWFEAASLPEAGGRRLAGALPDGTVTEVALHSDHEFRVLCARLGIGPFPNMSEYIAAYNATQETTPIVRGET